VLIAGRVLVKLAQNFVNDCLIGLGPDITAMSTMTSLKPSKVNKLLLRHFKVPGTNTRAQMPDMRLRKTAIARKE
jgi:hypothetical protein